MRTFYETVFGWQTQQHGPEMNNYVTVATTKFDPVTMRPLQPGAINGGFYQRGDTPSTQVPSLVIGVDDIHAHLEKIKAAGGTILNEPVMIPGVGMYASFQDTEGNYMSVMQPNAM